MLLMYVFMLAVFTWEHTGQSDSVGALKGCIQMFVDNNNTHTRLRKQQFTQKSNGSARCMLLQLLKVDKAQKKTLTQQNL